MGADVKVTMDPGYTRSNKVTLRDATQTVVPEVTGVTGPNGKAPIWVRLSCVYQPFKMRLIAEIVAQKSSVNAESNLFKVCGADAYGNY